MIPTHCTKVRRLVRGLEGRWLILGIILGLTLSGSVNASADLSMIVAGEVEKVAGGFQFVEGPVWHPGGYLLFSDIPANKIVKWTPSGKAEVFREPSGQSNGLTFDRQGRLIACEHGNRRVSRTEKDGSIVTLADKFEGKRLNSPNDLCARSDGTIYFTDPDYGTPKGQKELDFQGVYRISPDGKLFLEAKERFLKPNGLALSPDERVLYVDDTEAGNVRAFDVKPDGALANDRILIQGPPLGGTDGMKVDVQGNLYVTADGVWVIDSSGNHLGTIKIPERPANCAFGDPDNKTLYITARNGLYRVRLKIQGVRVLPETSGTGSDTKGSGGKSKG
jgi:sugar lactone lactonase YvrE